MSVTAGRTPLGHGRNPWSHDRTALNGRTAVAPGSSASDRSTAHKAAPVTDSIHATSSTDFFGGGNKENTPQSGKLQGAFITGSVKSRAVLSLLTNMAPPSSFRGRFDGASATPGITPHALQLCPGAVPFWGPHPHCFGHSHAAFSSTDGSITESDATTAVAAFITVAEEITATVEGQHEPPAKSAVAEVTANEQGCSDLEVPLPMSERAEASTAVPLATAAQQAATAAQQAATADSPVPSACASELPSPACLVSSDNKAGRRPTTTSPASAGQVPSSGTPGRAAARTRRRPAPPSAAIPVISRRVTRSQTAAPRNAECKQNRSQLAAQQHISRMQTRSRTAQSARH